MKALITGISGQDGAYLAKFLLDKGYEVEGLVRRNASQEYWRLKYLGIFDKVKLHEAELTEKYQIEDIFKNSNYTEVYNLAAQSFVGTSFNSPFYTMEVNTISVINILECIKRFNPEIKLYQASTSEMFGKIQEEKQNEQTPFYPRSPYGVSKLAAHWMVTNYRESYDIFTCSGILFNHESPLRGQEFITKKITRSVAEIQKGKRKSIEIGNLYSSRDWGYAADYVEAMYLMMQLKNPEDFVIGSGKSHSVKDLIERSFSFIDKDIVWDGEGLNEVGIDKLSGKKVIKISEDFFRPAEVEMLVADAGKAKKILNWEPKVDFDTLVKMMIDYDLNNI